MMRIGLTGGIGSGKSTVAGFFQALGVPVYDSDARARILMEEDEELKAGIQNLLGASSYKDGVLNRSHIASRVFADQGLLQQLNALVHPAVRKDFQNWCKRQQAPYVLQEAAILIENEAYRNLDRMILVTAPSEERIRRVMSRDAASREEVLSRMNHQWPDEDKIGWADYIIENIELDSAKREVDRIHRELLQLSGPESAS